MTMARKNQTPLGQFINLRPTLSPQETKEKLIAYRKNPTIELRNEIVEDNLRLVVKYASECSRDWHCPIEDLIQEGSLGLIRAVDDYDPSRNTAFSTLAMTYIKNAIFHYLGRYGKTIRIPPSLSSKIRQVDRVKEDLIQKLHREPTDEEVCEALNDGTTLTDLHRFRLYSSNVLSLDAKSDDEEQKKAIETRLADPDSDPHETALDKDRYEAVLKALSQLDPKDREILVLRNKEKPMTLSEIGKKFGISPEAVRQRENRAMAKLKEKIQGF